MGKKSICCKKKSTSTCCDDSSSSSSATYGFCCSKYPKCRCIVNKCAPIYYPNNCVGQVPCNPCKPSYPIYPSYPPSCPPSYPPSCPPSYPPSCPPYHPNQCVPTYNSYNNIITGNPILFNLLTQYTLYIVNPSDTSGNLYLPAISSLGACCYNKIFIISNISSNNITINPSQTNTTNDSINGLINKIIIEHSSVSIYSTYIPSLNTGYWSLI